MNKQVIVAIIVLVIAFGGIGGFFAFQPSASPQERQTYPISVIDDVGRNITIAKYPNKIVSLAPSTTEIIFGLGLAEKVIGLVSYSGYDAYIQDEITNRNLTIVGTFSKVNVELVTGLQPDLIVASGAYQIGLAAKFEEQGKTTIILNPKNFSGILSDIILIGKVSGQDENAATLVGSMKSKAEEVSLKTSGTDKPSIYVEYYVDKSGFSSYGANSYINELISMAGGVNVFAGFSGQYVTTSTEEILKANPSIIVISKGVMSQLSGITPESIKSREGWNNTVAVQNEEIFEINENLLTIWGPRIVDGLEALARVIHPEVFATQASAAPKKP